MTVGFGRGGGLSHEPACSRPSAVKVGMGNVRFSLRNPDEGNGGGSIVRFDASLEGRTMSACDDLLVEERYAGPVDGLSDMVMFPLPDDLGVDVRMNGSSRLGGTAVLPS